jgi:hypothetical protein
MGKGPPTLLVWLVRKVNVVDSFVMAKEKKAVESVRILGVEMWKSWGRVSGAKFVHP